MKKFVSMAAVVVLAALLIIPQTGCGSNTEPVSKESFYFDTTCKISIYDMKDMSEKKANVAIDKAFKQCARYENLLSKTKKGSDIYKINHAGGKTVKCDPITVEVIKKGIRYGKMTGGKFDITIGKAEDLWDFHGSNQKPPDAEKLAEAMKYVDYRQIHVSGNTVTMGTAKGEIDLGGIAKGYIADRVSEYLRKLGVTSAIISLGGNIECIGDKAGSDFNIGIEKPYSDQSEIVGATPLSDGTIVTSGVYERYFEYKGKKYHHILNSKTGMPVETDVTGVSIRSTKGHSADCDALSTTCLILGKEKGKKLIEGMDGYEALFILSDDKIVKTKGFEFKEE